MTDSSLGTTLGKMTCASTPSTTSSASADEATRFYLKGLEQAGQLRDVGWDTDFSTLPSGVTHVRCPDGTVRRIGFS